MHPLARASAALGEAERSLQAAMSEALAANDYVVVARIARVAESVSELAAGLPADQAAAVAAGGSAATAVSSPAAKAVKPMSRSASRATRASSAAKATYPRYLRDGDRLVKVGWSKKHKSEYEHRAPRAVVQAVAQSLADKVTPGKVFDTAQVLPIHLDQDEVPSYQSYLVLGWLQDAGLIEKKGRDGYVLRQNGAAVSDLGKQWESLPVKPV